MPNDVPRTTLDARYSEPDAPATAWPDDLVLHGDAVVVHDLPLLRRVADAFLAKYGSDWAFEVGGRHL